MHYTITRTLQGGETTTLIKTGEFVPHPPDDERREFHTLDEALHATVELQVKHDLREIKSPCTYSLNRLEDLPQAA